MGLRCRPRRLPLTGEPVEPDPVSTGVGSGNLPKSLAFNFSESAAWASKFGLVLACGLGLSQPLVAASEPLPAAGELEEIVVTASLRPEPLAAFPASVTVLDAAVLEAAGLQHLQDVAGLVPNLSWSGGTSRPRYFLLRGVGELEQYQGAPNPSVGFLIDGIDFSGVGMPATSFDLEQVEVLRGPQGTRHGANALAGLINVRSRAPRPETELATELSAGEDGLWSAGLVAGGGLGARAGEAAAWRLAAQQSSSDGFRDNRYVGRDDTNRRDELTLRGRLALEPTDGWSAGFTLLHADLDNGFDAFVPDNSLRTLSDRPGRDAQRSTGAALDLTGELGPGTLRSLTTAADSDIVYSFDGDWGNDDFWGEFAPYDYWSRYDRERRSLSQDLRLASRGTASEDGRGWLVGAYLLQLEESNRQRDEFARELLRPPLESDYEALSLAVYGEAERRVPGDLVLTAGLRLETRAADYADSDGTAFDPRDTMLGGHLSVGGEAGAGGGWYLTASRGYKAGGFNIGLLVPEERREFEPEYLWNLEAGLRRASADGRFAAEAAVFYMWRESQQVATSFQLDPGDPLSYVFLTDNAARGRNAGLEGALSWRVRPTLTLGGTLGLLHSEYLDYRYGERDLDGREQAHAPGWQYSLSAEWAAPRGWTARADLVGSDAFYFDASHDQRSEPYTLLNFKAGWVGRRWSVLAWGRNVLDERYAVRGFYFGLEPPDFPNRLYVQQGDPRQFGVTLRWSLR
jgi:outer membrane receptor protein involved in Fe transport